MEKKPMTVGELVTIGMQGLSLREQIVRKDPVTHRSIADKNLAAARAARREGNMDRDVQEQMAIVQRFRRGRYPID